MGFAELSKAAKKLRKNLDEGVDLKESVRLFAEEVEKDAKETSEALDKIRLKNSTTKDEDN